MVNGLFVWIACRFVEKVESGWRKSFQAKNSLLFPWNSICCRLEQKGGQTYFNVSFHQELISSYHNFSISSQLTDRLLLPRHIYSQILFFKSFTQLLFSTVTCSEPTHNRQTCISNFMSGTMHDILYKLFVWDAADDFSNIKSMKPGFWRYFWRERNRLRKSIYPLINFRLITPLIR